MVRPGRCEGTDELAAVAALVALEAVALSLRVDAEAVAVAHAGAGRGGQGHGGGECECERERGAGTEGAEEPEHVEYSRGARSASQVHSSCVELCCVELSCGAEGGELEE